MRDAGAEYLVFPRTSLWWLDHYREFHEHLDARYPRVVEDRDVAVIYGLAEKVAIADVPASEIHGQQAPSSLLPTRR